MRDADAKALVRRKARPKHAPAAKAPTPTGSLRRSAVEGERMTVYLPPDLHQAVRELAFRDRRSLSNVMAEAAQLLLNARRSK